MRLDKYLAETAQCTRSEAKALLAKGRVQVNGAVCKKGDTQLKETDTVAVDGQPLAYQQFVYLMLNKPEGVVSASTDRRDTTVVGLLGDAYRRRAVFQEGRRAKLYFPAVVREDAIEAETETFLDKVGGLGLLMSAMVEKNALTEHDIAELSAILEKAGGKT